MATLAERVAALEAQVLVLLEQSSNHKRSPECRLGLDPLTCTKASPHHYQKGCGGAACAVARRAYYGKNGTRQQKAAPVSPPKRKKRI